MQWGRGADETAALCAVIKAPRVQKGLTQPRDIVTGITAADVRKYRGVDRAVDQIEKAKRELARGNFVGATYFLDQAEGLYDMRHVNPLTATRIVRAAERHEPVQKGAREGGRIRGEQQRQEKEERDDVAIVRGRGNVSSVITNLALKKDTMGDYLHLKDELWLELVGELDILFHHVQEVSDDSGNPVRIDYRDAEGTPGQITFASFKTMVYTARKKYK